jgi:cohesin loading factor subunit SCC2
LSSDLVSADKQDPGLAVRKRIIKLLKGVFGTTGRREIKVDICCKLIALSADKDEGIQELAVKTVTEILYASTGDQADQASLVVDVLAEFQGGLSVLENAAQQVSGREMESADPQIAKESEKTYSGRFASSVDAIFDRLSDATERSDIVSSRLDIKLALALMSGPNYLHPGFVPSHHCQTGSDQYPES